MSKATISPGAGEFSPALSLGTAWPHPKERNGKPCFYYWKTALTTARKNTWGRDGTPGAPIDTPPERIDRIVRDYKRALAAGYEAALPDEHSGATKNYGWIVDARKGADGSLELLHQFVGEAERNEALNKKTSICTLENVTDEHGNRYEELIDHNAVIVNPQLNNLGDFTPAIAASRGHAIDAVVLETAAEPPNKESTVDLKALRKAIGAADDVTDDKVIETAAARLTEAVPALELSRTQGTTIATLTAERDTLKGERDAAQARALELSRGAVTDDVLPREVDFAKRQIALALGQGRCSKPAADYLTSVVERDGKPAPAAALMLSRTGPDGSPIDVALKLLELNRGLAGFQQTDAQPVGRTVPGGTPEDKPITPARKAELLAHVGA
jgi:hypothetical protein